MVLPARIWAEQNGHVINLEGKSSPVTPLIQAPKSVHADWETLLQLSTRMGYALSYDEISDICDGGVVGAGQRQPSDSGRELMPNGDWMLTEECRWQRKVTVASDWLAGCAGCHMSLLDMDERHRRPPRAGRR